MKISNKELILNIALNLKRIARFAEVNNEKRVILFIKDTEQYINALDNIDGNSKFIRTYINFTKLFNIIKSTKSFDNNLIDDIYTYSNILSHRSNLL